MYSSICWYVLLLQNSKIFFVFIKRTHAHLSFHSQVSHILHVCCKWNTQVTVLSDSATCQGHISALNKIYIHLSYFFVTFSAYTCSFCVIHLNKVGIYENIGNYKNIESKREDYLPIFHIFNKVVASLFHFFGRDLIIKRLILPGRVSKWKLQQWG